MTKVLKRDVENSTNCEMSEHATTLHTTHTVRYEAGKHSQTNSGAPTPTVKSEISAAI